MNKLGLYLHGELMVEYDDVIEVYESAKFAFEETGIIHEVKLVNK